VPAEAAAAHALSYEVRASSKRPALAAACSRVHSGSSQVGLGAALRLPPPLVRRVMGDEGPRAVPEAAASARASKRCFRFSAHTACTASAASAAAFSAAACLTESAVAAAIASSRTATPRASRAAVACCIARASMLLLVCSAASAARSCHSMPLLQPCVHTFTGSRRDPMLVCDAVRSATRW